jgi:hypothetical protein
MEAQRIADDLVTRRHHLATPIEKVYARKELFDLSRWQWSVIYHSIPIQPGCDEFAVLVGGETGKARLIKKRER